MDTDTPVKVAVLKSTYQNVYDNIEKMIELLDYAPQKDAIFIKPNLVDSYSPKTGIITSPKIVEALVKYFRKNYPEKPIVIGDGCALHADMDAVMEKAGYRYLTEKYGAEIVNLDEAARRTFTWEHGSIELPGYLDTHEYINVPKLKTHSMTSVSLGLKNQKGLLHRKDKKDFHRKHDLHSSVKQLADLVSPDLNIIDGILSLEGRGPIHQGTPKKNTNLIIGSKNIFAVDNAAAILMGFDVAEIEHIPGFSDFLEVGEKIADCVIPFKKSDPPPWIDKNVYCHFDAKTCSVCPMVLEAAFKPCFSNMGFIFKLILAGGMSGRKDIILGKLDRIPEDAGAAICIGNCGIELSKKYHIPVVKGCPPKPEDIRNEYLRFCRNTKNGNS
jgi:uncharacterized protein (DUF362 family)